MTSGLVSSSILFSSLMIHTNAMVASIADVGVREFLVKDGRQFLRLTIPLGDDDGFNSSPEAQDLKIAQENLELVRLRLEQVGFTNPSAWAPALKDATTAANIIKSNRPFLVSGSDSSSTISSQIFDNNLIPQLTVLNDAIRVKDVTNTLNAQELSAKALADLRQLHLPKKQLPFTIPSEYMKLPRLMGRATVEMVLKSPRGYRLEDGKTVVPKVALTLELDGYHTPITAGNFIDLVNRGYYDNMPLQRVEELTIQTGASPGKSSRATIPLELFYKNDKEPVYGITSDDDVRATDTMALPFQAYGALGMARDNDGADTASTEFFFLKWKQALIAPGRNTLDGFYSCFGYVSSNEQLLSQVDLNSDIIESARVVKGAENLVLPSD